MPKQLLRYIKRKSRNKWNRSKAHTGKYKKINVIKAEETQPKTENAPVLRVKSLAELGDPQKSLPNPNVQKHLVQLVKSNLPDHVGKRFMLNTSSTGVKYLTPIDPDLQGQGGKRYFLVKNSPSTNPPTLTTQAIQEPVPEKHLLKMQQASQNVFREPTISAKLHILKMQSTDRELEATEAAPINWNESSASLFTCAHCSLEFPSQSDLAHHLKMLELQCNSCKKVFKSVPELRKHLKGVHRIKGYKCKNCDYLGTCMWDLKLHQSRDHCQDYSNPCNECDKVFKNSEVLEQHVKLVHENPSSSSDLLCEVCGKPFKNYYTLQRHTESAHENNQYPCKECKKVLYSRYSFGRHMKWHANKEKIVCELCGKSFTIKHDLLVHMRQHTGEKPYQCSICSKAFAKRTTLRQHLLIHTGVRPYVCDICGKSFTQKPGLTGHRKSHPGDLPPMPSLFIDDILKDLPEDAFQNLGPKPNVSTEKTETTENVEGNGNEGTKKKDDEEKKKNDEEKKKDDEEKKKDDEEKKKNDEEKKKNDEEKESKRKTKGKSPKGKKGKKNDTDEWTLDAQLP